jgi:hypothetical protein
LFKAFTFGFGCIKFGPEIFQLLTSVIALKPVPPYRVERLVALGTMALKIIQ